MARKGNLTRAAEELNLTQPAVSAQIKSLESELGDLLFERKGRGLLLTRVGELLLSRGEQMLELAEHTRREITALGGLDRGAVEIGTNDSNCLYMLPEVIAAFRKEYPGVRVHLDNSHSSQVARWVVEGRVEIGVVTLPVAEKGLSEHVLYEREDVLICRPDHPLAELSEITSADLSAHPLLLLHGGSTSHGRLMYTLSEALGLPTTTMHVGSIEVIKRYVEIGLGVSIIPRLNAAYEIASSRLCAKKLGWLPVNYVGVIHRKNGYLSPAARIFLEKLRAHVETTL